jgi:hypothetical protein
MEETGKGGNTVVKGISRRVIVVRSPDQRFFEQAIFLLREDVLHANAVTEEQVVRQARQAAALYVQRSARQREGVERLPGWLWYLLGAGTVCALWSGTNLF